MLLPLRKLSTQAKELLQDIQVPTGGAPKQLGTPLSSVLLLAGLGDLCRPLSSKGTLRSHDSARSLSGDLIILQVIQQQASVSQCCKLLVR